ncbi:MAG TPA: response regulator, partial [Candidatus Polarisedimenticolia bacterium]|nr:response regulator [Candidatus Polarisedimenticolia bacterium]
RMRCAGCGRVFTIQEGALAAGGVPDRPSESPAGRPPSPAVRPKSSSGSTARNPPLVPVGDDAREFRDLVRRTLVGLGCKVEVTTDGEAAFRFAVAHHPDLMVLNVYLTRLLGVAVCEGVKGSPDLKGTRVALVGSVFKSDRFIRHPAHLYGADDYFEDVISEPQLRARLSALLAGEAVHRLTAAPAPGPAPVAPGADALLEIDASAPKTNRDPLSPNGADEPIDPRSEIHRLARIMVSDLKMYHPDEFRRAVLERRFSEAFREEMTQAKDLIARRFPGLADRMTVLTEALKEQIALERGPAARRPSGSST